MNWKDFLNNFWGEFNACSEKALELRTRDILDQLNESLGNHIFKDDLEVLIENVLNVKGGLSLKQVEMELLLVALPIQSVNIQEHLDQIVI